MTSASAKSHEFVIPADLLKHFSEEVRVIPNHLPTNGYIVFDRAMLVAALRGNDANARVALANSIDALGKNGGELVVMQKPVAG
jgi:hypothetical protein